MMRSPTPKGCIEKRYIALSQSCLMLLPNTNEKESSVAERPAQVLAKREGEKIAIAMNAQMMSLTTRTAVKHCCTTVCVSSSVAARFLRFLERAKG